jgi:hypothetical protein
MTSSGRSRGRMGVLRSLQTMEAWGVLRVLKRKLQGEFSVDVDKYPREYKPFGTPESLFKALRTGMQSIFFIIWFSIV